MAEGASLTVLGGPMAGTCLVIDDAVDEILVGSDPDCRLCLDLPGVSPIHARVWRDLGGITVYDTRSPRGLYVNDDRVVDQSPLHDGDVLWLGEPGDPDSVMIQCRLPEESILGAPVGEVGSPAAEDPAPPVADEAEALVDELGMAAPAAVPAPPESPAEPLFADEPAISDEPPIPDEPAILDEPAIADELLTRDEPGISDELAIPDEPAMTEAPPIAEASPSPASDPLDAPIPVSTDAPDIITEAWAEQAPVPAESAPPPPPAAQADAGEPEFFTDEPDAVDTASLLDLPPPVEAPAAPTPEAAAAPTLVDSATPPVAENPPVSLADDSNDFATDPAWGAYDTIEAPPATTPPLDIDSLLGDAPAPQEAAPAARAQPFEPAIALGAPASSSSAAPAPAVAAAPAPAVGGAPPLVRPPRAIIDDTRPRPAPRKADARAGPPEGVMDWAQGAASPRFEEEPPPPSVRPAMRAARAERSGRGPLLPIAGAVVLAAALAGGYFAWSASREPRIDGVSPSRVTTGSTLTLTGSHLGESTGATSAFIGGRPARVVQATGDRLQIEVPELEASSGGDASFPVTVSVGGRESKPFNVAVYHAPRLRSLVPDVGMPGEDVVLSGTSLGAGVKVRFGDVEAKVVNTTPTSLTVRVPALSALAGTEVPVVAALGPDPSNEITFVIGKVPLVTGIEPRVASPGDLVTIAGRGFNAQATANRVTIGGVPALVVSATARGLDVVVPRVIAGEEGVAITVPGSTHVGQGGLAVNALDEPVGFRFVAEPFDDVPGHEHAALATGLGPAFILTSGQGKSAAERAYEAQKRFNDSAQVLRSTRTADIRARYEPAPALYLAARDTVLLDVLAADAEAYNEDWTRTRAQGRPVTPARLATWWEGVARDLVLLLLRGEKPEHAQALAPEGKVLADVHDAARRTSAVGVPGTLITQARGPLREGLRAIALRVPATVSAPVTAPAGAAPVAADAVAALRLDGTWRGTETESGAQTTITVVFRGGSGTLTYERALSLSVPVLGVQQPQKGAVRFEVRVGGGTRYYRGRWDGSKITGTLTSDAGGRTEVGTFELEPPG